MNVQFAGFLFDRLIAPEFFTLARISLPDVPELPNYYGSYFLQNIFRSENEDRSRPLVFAFLRHLNQGIREYRSGRLALLEFGSTEQHSNNAIAHYLHALTHFEQAVFHCDIAASASHAIARCIVASTPEKHFTPGGRAPEDRLRHLYNAVKHFDETVAEGALVDYVSPIWLVSEGVRGIKNDRKSGLPVIETLKFEEMAVIFLELASNAAFLAEEVFRIAHERQAVKIAGNKESLR
ncbi:hypothetical protein [Rhodomicrobium sp.]|uniref:hypothetical protein n=1 Tax=Rhodomicrobium sp. TaxID=2720632 RepID=UPI0039E23BB9